MTIHFSIPKTWMQPDWPHIPGVHALFTSRDGGVSHAPFDSMNLGDHVRDSPENVRRNRQYLESVIQNLTPGARPVFLQQVHGCEVVNLTPRSENGQSADACVTQKPRQVCTIMVADCLPVLFAHPSHRVVAAAHAGWRGLLGEKGVGVLETTVHRLLGLIASDKLADSDTGEMAIATSANYLESNPSLHPDALSKIQVWLGPCIGRDAFEVGDEVRDAFVSLNVQYQHCFRPVDVPGKWWFDLAELARHKLREMGISNIYGNDSTPEWCTVMQPSRFYSHRRDATKLGSTGRMAACIWMEPEAE